MLSEQNLCRAFVLASLFMFSATLVRAQQAYNSASKLSASWINNPTFVANETDFGSHTFTPILRRVVGQSAYFCGFYCKNGDDVSNIYDSSKDCVFGVIITVYRNDTSQDSFLRFPQLVWSANRNTPVQVNAKLELNQDGELTLRNSHDTGTLVWSSQTGGKSVAGMNLTENGNLVLFGRNNETIWQSFDHPTDSLLVGQKLNGGQNLTASVSASNWSEGLPYLSVDSGELAAYINSDPPQKYYSSSFHENLSYVEFTRGSFHDFTFSPAAQILKLGPDGQLKAFQVDNQNGWTEVADYIKLDSGACSYPLVCGRYGICAAGGQCDCPETETLYDLTHRYTHFTRINSRKPNLGCSLVTPISCDHSQYHSFVELSNTYYFAFHSYTEDTLVEDCQVLCLGNCSCKAALFVRSWNSSSRKGSCLLVNEVFSIAKNENGMVSPYYSTLYIKVHDPDRSEVSTLASVISVSFGVFCVIGCLFVFFRKRYSAWNEIDEHFLNHVAGMPTRYSFEILKATTKHFRKKLGEGGFGSVYKGTLTDGRKVAVKFLDGLAKVNDSFLVEVKAIGSIHHVNLVKLIGYCFEKSHRLLVYEYMANRSLDGWIFGGKEENHCLPWQARRNIITDVAKGLAYLHEECSQKIIHLDIKPQNILLDKHFNAKISDFGLSKLIEKDQSRVITTMRGTPGYLAPEWLSSVITEKVDVYSFGIVMLEIICGRKNLDWSRTEEDRHLLAVFKEKAEEGKLEELVDARSEDMHDKIEDVLKMTGIAAWCLQSDFRKRPSMSTVVKVLEGLVAAETNISHDFLNPTTITGMAATDPTGVAAYGDTKVFPSELSGPR